VRRNSLDRCKSLGWALKIFKKWQSVKVAIFSFAYLYTKLLLQKFIKTVTPEPRAINPLFSV
jgi:hypothetical protein